MYHPGLSELRRLGHQGNLVPVWRELPADLETPVSVYLKLRGENPAFLLESVDKGEHVGRYSFVGVEPSGILTARDGQLSLEENGSTEHFNASGNPLDGARKILARYRPVAVEGLPRFSGGMVGYLGYETARFYDRVPVAPRLGLSLPDAVFLLTDTVVIFDHVKRRMLVVANAHVRGDPKTAYRVAVDRIEAIVSRLNRPLDVPPTAPPNGNGSNGSWQSNFQQADFEAAVHRAKEYIAAGDIFQAVLSQRLSRRTEANPFAIYRALRMTNPSPYMFYLKLPGDLCLIGASPEMLVRLEDGRAELRPIAGTRPRSADPAEDEVLAQELLADPKERAEHVMLLDLGRNDLGRVCRYGSVHVPEQMVIERYSHVMHIVSSVAGELRPDLDAFDLMAAAFPAGTVSGAPKIRAMQIIAELEQERRGPYAGAVGYFGYSGNMDTCIAIRTIVMQGRMAHVQAGAGIVADSDPTREYQETLSKAQALLEATTVAEQADQGGTDDDRRDR
jgi:anthranilate synthase component 1